MLHATSPPTPAALCAHSHPRHVIGAKLGGAIGRHSDLLCLIHSCCRLRAVHLQKEGQGRVRHGGWAAAAAGAAGGHCPPPRAPRALHDAAIGMAGCQGVTSGAKRGSPQPGTPSPAPTQPEIDRALERPWRAAAPCCTSWTDGTRARTQLEARCPDVSAPPQGLQEGDAGSHLRRFGAAISIPAV